MKKIVKPLAAVFAAVMVFSMMSFAFAAVGAKFSINLASETDSQVIIEVKLESGSFQNIDFGVTSNPAKIKACTKITPNMTIALEGAQASNTATGLFGCSIDAGFAEEGGVIATYTFEKVAGTNISKDDFELNVTNCSAEFEVVNNIPVYVEPSTEETTEPSTEPPTEEPTEPEYTEPSTEESTEASTNPTSGKPIFSLNLADETATQVVLTVKLDSGSFNVFEFGITYNLAKVKKCTKIVGNTDIALEGTQQYYAPTGLYSAAVKPAYDKAGGVIATYTFEKVPGKYITKDDFSLKISNCEDDVGPVTAGVRNNLPSVPANETPTNPSEPSTEIPTEAPTEVPTEPEHNFSEWYYIQEATCTTPGLTIRYCKICNEVEFKAVDVLPHSYESVVTPPTCTEAGYVTYTCSCGDCYTEPYAGSLGHSFGKWIETKPATCTTKGEIKSSCSRCGETKTIETEVSDTKHTTGEWEVFEEATPFASGVEVKRCLYCGIIADARSLAFKGGKIHSVSIGDISMSYKDSATITPNISADAGVDYTVTYSSSNTDVVSIDANGKLTTNGTGDATITVTVIDQYGREVTDTCKVNVSYKWWQWIIVIVLFGWIWY